MNDEQEQSDLTEQADHTPETGRAADGKFGKGNKFFRRRKKKTSQEAKSKLPIATERAIDAAVEDREWFRRLRDSDPKLFTQILSSLIHFRSVEERISEKGPPEEGLQIMSPQEAAAILEKLKKEWKG